MVFTFKSVDTWLGEQSFWPRAKWSAIYLSDVVVEAFNNIQRAISGERNQVASRILAGLLAFGFLILPWILFIWSI